MEIEVDWSTLFFDLESKLSAVAERRYYRSPDAGAAFNFAFEKISADNWGRLRNGFEGRGSPTGFLRVTFLRLLEDYATAKYGRKVPPLWLRRLGALWKRIYQLLCLERQLPATIVDVLTARSQHSANEIRYAIEQIRGRIPDCGAYRGEQTREDLDTRASSEAALCGELESSEQLTILSVLRGMLVDASSHSGAVFAAVGNDNPATDSLGKKLEEAVVAVALTNQERLLLKLVYEERLTITASSAALHLPRKTVSRMHQRVTKRLKDALAPLGLDDPDRVHA